MLRKDTEFLRATCSQEIRCILQPENDGQEGTVRRVQVLVPLDPKTLISLEPDADRVFGTDRLYKMSVAPPGAAIVLWLRPNQSIYACAYSGTSELTITVEYHDQFR